MSETTPSDAAGLNEQQSSEHPAGSNDGADRTKLFSEAYNKAASKFQSELESERKRVRELEAKLTQGKSAEDLRAEVGVLQSNFEAAKSKYEDREKQLLGALQADIEARRSRLSEAAAEMLEVAAGDDPVKALRLLPTLEKLSQAAKPAQGGIAAGKSDSAKEIASAYHKALNAGDAVALRKVIEQHGREAVDQAVSQFPRG